jgi:TnpA family transposase
MRVEHLIAKSSQESLNVIEKWNGANSFILTAKAGDRYQRPGETGTHQPC